MDSSSLGLFKISKIFSSLSEEALQHLLGKLQPCEMLENEILFSQGDPSDSVYLVVSGKLAAQLTTFTGDIRILGYVEVGETVGELGVLANEPRSLTIKALVPSRLLKLPANEFIDLCHQYPSVLFAAIQPVISRSEHVIELLYSEQANKHIVLTPAQKAQDMQFFAELVQEGMMRFPGSLVVSDFQEEFRDQNSKVIEVRDKIKRLSKNKSKYRIIYLLKSFDTPLARYAFQQADSIYVVGDSTLEPKIDSHVIAKIESRRVHLFSAPRLVLLHSSDGIPPGQTGKWLGLMQFSFYHHLYLQNKKQLARLLRFLRGKAVGVVLSGGGTRGWAHIGAIKAIREAKIPIDMIGGTSVGAVVAACYAMDPSIESVLVKFRKIITESIGSVSVFSLTWPLVSLFNGKRYTISLKDAFGDIRIEELAMPFFCVSCNLTTNLEYIHREGLLWERLRASSSIPGLIPPVSIEGDVHLDGGLLNNLPVDVMRQFIEKKGRIIAIELNSYAPLNKKYQFPPIMTVKDGIMERLGWSDGKNVYPSFVDTFLRGLFVGALSKAKANSLDANTCVSLDLSHFRLFQPDLSEIEQLIEIGYNETKKQLQAAKNQPLLPPLTLEE